MEIIVEQREKNYSLFINKLQKLGIETTEIENNLKNELINATYSNNNFISVSGEGTLLHVVLRILTPLAVKIHEISEEEINLESLIKVCLLSQISKALMFKKNEKDNSFSYASFPYAMRMGLRSVAMCQKFNIPLTDEEIEAMTILDGDNEDDYKKFYCSPMATIIRTANDLTNMKIKKIK